MIFQKHSGDGDNLSLTIKNRPKLPSTLTEIINLIAKSPQNQDSMLSGLDELKGYKISDKIKHNNLQVYAGIVDEYKKYYGAINSIYAIFDQQGSDKKEKVLRRIRNRYEILRDWFKKEEGITVDEVIKEYSDTIFQTLFNEFKDDIMESLNIDEDRTIEDVEIGLYIALVDAFIKCKILEEPD